MKLIQVSFNIDVCNAAHVAALHNFMNVLGEHTGATPIAPIATVPAPPAEPAKKTRAKATPPPVVETPQEPESESELIDETTAPATTAPAEPEAVVSVTMLRTTVSDLVKSNSELRETIVAKLAELNAQSVSTLAVKHFDTFYNFLKTLE